MRKIERAVVVGAGTMGHGIAQVLAQAGIDTARVDVTQDFVDRGLAHIKDNLEAGVAKGKVAPQARDLALGNLSGSTDLESALAAADLLVEAIPEDMKKKRELFSIADAKMHPAAILASNTSSLSITEIASATKRPEHVVGRDRTGTHDPDHPDVGGILQAADAGEVRPGIGAPVADDGDDLRFPTFLGFCLIHSFSIHYGTAFRYTATICAMTSSLLKPFRSTAFMRHEAVHMPQPLQSTALTTAQPSATSTAMAPKGQLVSQRPQAEQRSLLT